MHLTTEQLDALQELLNMGVGRAADSLNQMTEKPIRLQTPKIQIGTMQDLVSGFILGESDKLSAIRLPFCGAFSGSAFIVFLSDGAAQLVNHLTGEAGNLESLDVLKEATLTEVGNILLNGVMGTVVNVLNQPLTYSVPTYIEASMENLLEMDSSQASEYILWTQTQCTIEEFNTTGVILLMFGVRDLILLQSALAELTGATPSSHD